MTENSDIKFVIRLLQGTGDFVMFEGGTVNLVCTGRCVLLDPDTGLELQDSIEAMVEDDQKQRMSGEYDYLTTRDIYKELRIRGYDYGSKFQGLYEARSDGKVGKVKWTGHFISFMDSLLHISLVAVPIRALFVPIGFESVRIDPKVLFSEIERQEKEKQEQELNEYHLKREFMYFSDKSNENQMFEKTVSERVEAVVEAKEETENAEKTSDLPIQFYQTAFMKLDETKISLVPVLFNTNTRAIYTLGLEVKGMIPFPIPRKVDQKGLLLEQYQYMPYIEEDILPMCAQKRAKAEEYAGLCNQLVNFLTVKMNGKAEAKPMKLDSKWLPLAMSYCKEVEMKEQNHFKMFMLLKELLELKLEKMESGEERLMYSTPVAEDKLNAEGKLNMELLIKYDLANDMLTLMQTNERMLRPLLDAVLENQVDRNNIKILEVNPSLYIFAPRILNLIKMSYVGNLNFDYTYANSGVQVASDEVRALNMKTLEWNRSTNAFITDMNTIDLLLYRLTNSTMATWDGRKQLEAFYDALKVNGFLMVLVRSDMHQMERQMLGQFAADVDNELCQPATVQKFIDMARQAKFGFVGMKKSEFGYSALMFRKTKPMPFAPENAQIVHVKTFDFNGWIEQLKEIIKAKEEDKTLWLVANEKINGLIGMVNCLRIEPGGANIRCIYDLDGTMPKTIDFTKSPYKEMAENDLVMNVFRQNRWGSFRYTTLGDEPETIETPYAYLDMQTRGDLTSFKWYESDHKHFHRLLSADQTPNMVMCDVYCSSLNFKDVMIATGRIQPGPESAIFDCVFGLEFSGRRQDNGKRVMGMVPFKGFATTITSLEEFLWDVPENWSLADAASVPVVYVTAYYALVVRGHVREGEKVLIHSAAGGVGQAAIRICQNLKCEIFVTVGTHAKREYLKKEFGIPEENIFNSRDISFERLIKERTKGTGVDIVLNSLAEDKLMVSF